MGANVSRGSFQNQPETKEKSLFRIPLLKQGETTTAGHPSQQYSCIYLSHCLSQQVISLCASDVKLMFKMFIQIF